MPSWQAVQLDWPASDAKPGEQGEHNAVAWLVEPEGPNMPSAQGVPAQDDRPMDDEYVPGVQSEHTAAADEKSAPYLPSAHGEPAHDERPVDDANVPGVQLTHNAAV